MCVSVRRRPSQCAFSLSSFTFSSLSACVWGFIHSFMLKNIPACILCCFSDWKICIWRSSLSLCSKEQMWWLFVLLLALECRLLPHLLKNLQFCFLSSVDEVRDSYRWSLWISRGGQPLQRGSELFVFKKRNMARRFHVFHSWFVCWTLCYVKHWKMNPPLNSIIFIPAVAEVEEGLGKKSKVTQKAGNGMGVMLGTS